MELARRERVFSLFDMEHIFIYLYAELLEPGYARKGNRKKVFREMISQLQHSFEFPNEFTINRVK
jgi:hypothetical protein